MGQSCEISVRFYQPPDDLERFFTTFYCVEIDPGDAPLISDSLHPEWGNIRIFEGARPDSRIGDWRLSGSNSVLTGPSKSPLYFTIGRTQFWGVGLLPLGWATFIGKPADDYADSVRDLSTSTEFGYFDSLTEAILDHGADEAAQLAGIIDFFRDRCPRCGTEDPRISRIHSVLVEPELPTVAGMAERCSLNQRTLERLCCKHFGFAPKLLLRRQRFMRSVADFMLDPSLGWIGAIDSLYFDQSHFVRDCKKFLGVSPSEYAAMDHPVMSSFLRERMRAHGSAVQTLDQPNGAGETAP